MKIWTQHENPQNYHIYQFHAHWHQVNGGYQITHHEEYHFLISSEFQQWGYPWLWWIPSCVLKSAVDLKKIFLVFLIINVSCNDPLQPTPNDDHVKTLDDWSASSSYSWQRMFNQFSLCSPLGFGWDDTYNVVTCKSVLGGNGKCILIRACDMTNIYTRTS